MHARTTPHLALAILPLALPLLAFSGPAAHAQVDPAAGPMGDLGAGLIGQSPLVSPMTTAPASSQPPFLAVAPATTAARWELPAVLTRPWLWRERLAIASTAGFGLRLC